jgi:Tfp pilus assembly protein PilV
MLRTACNKRGLTIVEVIITVFLTAVGILALLSMQPTSWKAASRSDYVGRAAGILHSELERNEIWIMNPNNTPVPTGVLASRTVNASSQSTAQAGDVPFTVNTTITPFGVTTNAWTVAIQVTWPGNTRGVRETAVVSRQDTFK